MPYEVRPHGERFCVFKPGESEPIDGGCHDTPQEAEDHRAALYANEPEAGKAIPKLVRKDASLQVLDGQANGPWEIMITTGGQDRQRDTVNPKGFRVDNYMKNPVVMWAHDYVGMTPAGGVPIGKTLSLQADQQGLIASFVFREPAHEMDFVRVVRSAWDQGILRAASVGFQPLSATENRAGGMDFHEQELFEWSLTGIPSNPATLRRSYEVALKAAGMGALLEDPRLFAGATLKDAETPPATPPPTEPEAAPPAVPAEDMLDEKLVQLLGEFIVNVQELINE